MSKQTEGGDVMNYNAIVMRGCERQKQTEIAGADGFNLASETIRDNAPTPRPADDTTMDLFSPVALWVSKAKAEREAVEAKRRRDEERAEAIRADLAKPKESWTREAIVEQLFQANILLAKLREKVRIAEESSSEGRGGDYFHFLAGEVDKATREREALRAALGRFE